METNSTKIKVGDYMLKDGTTVNPKKITEEQKSQAIGIVAYLYKEHRNVFLKNGVKEALKAKGIERPHGIVIALKNADGGNKKFYEWGKDDNPPIYKSLNEQISYGADGVEMTDYLTNIEDFPAFKAAKEYEQEVPAPENTTGWYLPSVGEWFCILNNYEVFSKYTSRNVGYWSSSEYSFDRAYGVRFFSDGNFDYTAYYRTYTHYVRPILAF